MIGLASKEGLLIPGLEQLSRSGRPGLQVMSLGCKQQLSLSGHHLQPRRLHGIEPQRRRSGPEPPAQSGLWHEDFPRLPRPDLAPRDCTRNHYPQPVHQLQFQLRTGFKLWRTAPLSNLFSTAVARPGPQKEFSNWRASSSRRIQRRKGGGKEVFLLQIHRHLKRWKICSPKVPEHTMRFPAKSRNISRTVLHLRRLLRLLLPGPVRT